jgi:CBS-domain-containing membrane protein/PII-like signaling protein
MAEEKVQRVRIYLSEQDQWDQTPLYIAVLERLKREGATGATAVHGLAGFGPGAGAAAARKGPRIGSTSAPVVIEWVDYASRIWQTLPLLVEEMVPDALVTTEGVNLYRARLKSHGFFGGEQTVGNIMQDTPQAVTQSATLGKVITLMLAHKQSIVPIINEHKKIVGVITELDIARRAGLKVPLNLLPLLTRDEGNDLLMPIAGRPVGEVMNQEWRSVQSGAFIPQALVLMIEWSYDQIPVIDHQDTLVGLVSWSDVLTAVIKNRKNSAESSGVESIEQPTPVSLVMQQSVHSIAINQTMGYAMQQLLESPERYLVVVDQKQHVQGHISDVGVFQRFNNIERAPLLRAIQTGKPLKPTDIPNANNSLEPLVERETPTLSPRDNITDAIQRLIELRLDRAPVVDEEGRLLGIIGRGGLLRALEQESA